MMVRLVLPILLASVILALGVPAISDSVREIEVAPVWSGHPVGFALLTHGQRQYVAFYDAERSMTVGVRSLDEAKWDFVRLPQQIGWDTHNYIAMGIDDDDRIHLSGNMHAGLLKYFRTTTPGDIHSFERILHMTGSDEEKCTYPQFRRGPAGEFIFTYRSGRSGNGDQIFNVYDHKTQTWRRLLDKPLTSGEGKMNAYLGNLFRTPDGYYHLVWVWRDGPGCELNHDICYARTKDQIHWETSSGKPYKLPITLKTAEIVDPIPVKSGVINGCASLGCDSKGRVIVSYHKFDSAGKTQAYNARLEEGRWRIYQTSQWDYRWDFSGGGSIVGEIGIGSVRLGSDGKLTQSYGHVKAGSGTWVLDEATLKPIDVLGKNAPRPAPAVPDPGAPPAMEPRSCGDSGSGPDPKVRYSLHWQTWGTNRDRPREGAPPSPTMLKLHEVKIGGG